jgi:hypothetical protein
MRIRNPARLSFRLLPLAVVVLLVLTLGPRQARGQTALGAYRDCMDAAAVEASTCYTKADGYLANKLCDWAWDINSAVCVRTLVKAIGL